MKFILAKNESTWDQMLETLSYFLSLFHSASLSPSPLSVFVSLASLSPLCLSVSSVNSQCQLNNLKIVPRSFRLKNRNVICLTIFVHFVPPHIKLLPVASIRKKKLSKDFYWSKSATANILFSFSVFTKKILSFFWIQKTKYIFFFFAFTHLWQGFCWVTYLSRCCGCSLKYTCNNYLLCLQLFLVSDSPFPLSQLTMYFYSKIRMLSGIKHH